jgi:hypothetical protein
MNKPNTIEELALAYIWALQTIEGEFSGDFDRSDREIDEMREHLEKTFDIKLR